MSRPLTQSDIIFPSLSNTPSLSSTLHSLKRSALSIHNRLSSIESDSLFVASVAEAYGLPLVANERCGSWYIPPENKKESCYFKSTDGHMNEWGFSVRRVNLQVVDAVARWGGCVIVDSTRRGKSMPDALSKTVPIWCCVLNRAIFGGELGRELYTSPQAVSASEHAQIEKRIDGFVRQFLEICKPNIKDMREKLGKPLRPIWVTRESTLPESTPEFPDFHPVVLCTASRRVRGAEVSEGGYIQGAADDHEAWAQGLTPQIFWSNKERLLTTNEEDLPDLIAELVREERGPDAIQTLIKPTSSLYISSSQNADLTPFDVIISCTSEPLTTTQRELQERPYLHLPCQTGKLGSRDLRTQLSRLPSFFASIPSSPAKILVCCSTGKDLSVGTALAILCLYANEEGHINTKSKREARNIDKTYIKQRLSWITTSNPALNPSRATLQSVNTMLMSGANPSNTAETTAPQSRLILVDANGTPIPQDQVSPQETTTLETQTQPLNLAQTPTLAPTTIFTSLQTTPTTPWTFTRTLTSTLPTHPSGTVTGTATLTLCSNTSVPTLLYHEQGDFITTNGMRFTASRKYVYQLKQDEEQENFIAVHFFDDERMRRKGDGDVDGGGIGEKGEGIGGLFVEMGGLEKGAEDGVWRARNRVQHLCAEDLYAASWKFGGAFGFAGGTEGESEWWEVRYDVKGPKKDYVSETRYTRM